jgi:hypothetical protein
MDSMIAIRDFYHVRGLTEIRQKRYNPRNRRRDSRSAGAPDHINYMTDALRSDRGSTPGDAPDRDRDARIEELLLTGLDHYFAGRHELAISVWTRVLFLDRGHAKARAYIERARGAVSERQREAEELFHTGADALKRGDRAAARRLLTSAVERGASGDDALALLHRLDRIEAGGTHLPSRSVQRQTNQGLGDIGQNGTLRRDSRIAWVTGGILAGILIAAMAGGYLWMVADPFEFDGATTALPPVAEDPLPVPAACEIRLMRAQDLFAKGRAHEALAALDGGDPDGRHRGGFDALRTTIQRQLLAAGRKEPSPRPARAPQ